MIKKTMTVLAAAAATSVLTMGTASATPIDLTLNGFDNGSRGFFFEASPVASTAPAVNTGGFSMTDTSGSLGDFIAWCLDIGHRAGSGSFSDVSLPFTNTVFDETGSVGRIQSFFDANYSETLTADTNASAGFQAGLWEVLYDSDYSLLSGDFQGRFENTANGALALGFANDFLAAAQSFSGPRVWNTTFLQSNATGSDQRQNLVTVSAIPLPASVLLMLAALGGMGIAARRRKAA